MLQYLSIEDTYTLLNTNEENKVNLNDSEFIRAFYELRYDDLNRKSIEKIGNVIKKIISDELAFKVAKTVLFVLLSKIERLYFENYCFLQFTESENNFDSTHINFFLDEEYFKYETLDDIMEKIQFRVSSQPALPL